MAETIEQIQTEMDVAQAGQPDLATLNSPSQSAIYTLWKYITAVVLNLQQQIWDVYKAAIELAIDKTAPSTPQWTQDKILKFQYDAATPQVAQLSLVDFTISYPIINPAFRVINQCAVVTIQNGFYLYKVAFNSTPLSGPQMTALAAYIELFKPAGINAIGVTSLPDYVMVGADIKYNGQYDAVISQTTQDAITAFLAAIPFNGVLNISNLYVVIMGVPGVTDVTFTDVAIRANAVAIVDATILVDAGDWQLTDVGTYSGNAIPDTAAGRTLTDTLNFIVA